MDSDSHEEEANASGYTRHRSPAFSREEVKTLICLIEKFKKIIMNKSTSAAASHSKDVTWSKISKLFNQHGFKHERSAESLKMKWDNLKKEAKKVSKNVFDVKHTEFDDVTTQIVTLMYEAENNSNTVVTEEIMDFDEELNELEKQKLTHDNVWEQEEDKIKVCDDNDRNNSRSMNRSMNFTPEESSLLLQCVRQEKKLVFCKSNTISANKLKNRAWNRITNAYNKLSPHKRSTKVLRTKFTNMKKFAKSVNFKDYSKYLHSKKRHEHLKEDTSDLKEDTCNEIKSEPFFEYEDHSDLEKDNDDDDDDDTRSDIREKTDGQFNFIPDPLSTVLNSDSGIDLINPSENKEAVRLKIQLLKYKMETAKLERKRIENAMQSETIENSLRLRAARLEAVAAAMKLPPSHPALAYTAEESPAHRYLIDYSET